MATVVAAATDVTPERGSRLGQGYLPALDGLRAVSVAAVVAFHLGHLRGGFLGVDVFFVISGFLITRLLVAEWERSGTIALAAFWGRRFRRLLPALFVLLVAVAAVSKAWLPAWRLGDVRDDSLAALAYVANWRFSLSGQSYFSQGLGPSPLRHTWSLAIEEQFYVLWPLLVLGALALGRRFDTRRVVGALAAAGAVASATWMVVAAGSGDDLSRVYYGTDTRAFALFAGAALGAAWDPWVAAPATRVLRRRRARRCSLAAVAGLAVLAVLVVLVPEDALGSYRGSFQLAAVAAAVVVAGLATGTGPLTTVLAIGPLRWLGRRSYGIYLWAWPVQVLAEERYDLGPVALPAVVVAASVALAAASFALVEEPVRTRRLPFVRWRPDPRPDRGRRVPGVAVAGIVALVVAGTVSLPAVGTPSAPAYLRTSDEDALAVALAPSDAAPAGAAPGGSTSTTVPGAPGPFAATAPLLVPATASADPAAVFDRPLYVLVTGDSVAWSLGAFLGDGLTASVKVSDRGIIACGIMPASADWIAGDHDPADYPDYCSKQPEADRLGLDAHPDVVLLWTGAWEVYDHRYEGRTYRVGSESYARLLEGLLQDRVDRYRAAGVGTVVPLVTCFGDTPEVFGDERLDADRVAWVNERLTAVADRNPGWVRLIDPGPVLCQPDGTARATMPDGGGIRVDGAHFDEGSAPWFWNTWLAGQLAAAFAP